MRSVFLKIAHISTVHRRDDSRIFWKECVSLARNPAYEVQLFVADGHGDDHRDGVTIRDIGAFGGRFERAFSGSMRMRNALRGYNPDVVHFHDSEVIFLGLLLQRSGKKVIYDVHEDVPRDIRIKQYLPVWIRPVLAGIAERVEAFAGRRLSAIVAATPFIQNRFPPDRSFVVRNLPDLKVSPANSLSAVAGPSICYVGTISEARGIVPLIEAIEKCTLPVRLALAGKFTSAALEERVKSLSGWSRVDYLGWVGHDEISEVLNSSSVGMVTLLPTDTHVESLPIKLFEYMACGLPVIASDFRYWRQILDGIDCAIFVDPSDSSAIAQAIDALLLDPNRARKMGQIGSAAVESKFNWRNEERTLMDVYRRLEMA